MLALVGTAAAVLLVVIFIWRLAKASTSKARAATSGPKKVQKKVQPPKQAAPAPAPKAENSQAEKPKAEKPKAEKPRQANTEAPTAAAAAAPAPSDDQWMETPAKAAAGKAAAKGAKKPKAEAPKKGAKAEVPEPEAAEEPSPPVEVDDAPSAADWEMAAVGPKKNQRRRERLDAEKQELQEKAPRPINQKPIPGMGPPEAAPAQAKGKATEVAGLKLTAEQEKQAAGEGAVKTLTVRVPEKMIGRVIGPKGATLKLIQEKTGVGRIDTIAEVFTITGPPKAVLLAEAAIKELAEKGYTTLQFDDFSQAFVQVHPSMFPEIIGKQGSVIRKIKEELGVEVNIPEIPREAITGTKKFKVTLAGSNESVQKAKDVLNEILMVYHHELTHPGFVHEEIEVEPWQLNWIIGKKGSEIRHIQANFKVRVYIANERSLNKATVIVGEPHSVERAKAYIEKVLWNAENVPRGREAQSGALDGDSWGDEEEHEDWMEGYLYKRK